MIAVAALRTKLIQMKHKLNTGVKDERLEALNYIHMFLKKHPKLSPLFQSDLETLAIKVLRKKPSERGISGKLMIPILECLLLTGISDSFEETALRIKNRAKKNKPTVYKLSNELLEKKHPKITLVEERTPKETVSVKKEIESLEEEIHSIKSASLIKVPEDDSWMERIEQRACLSPDSRFLGKEHTDQIRQICLDALAIETGSRAYELMEKSLASHAKNLKLYFSRGYKVHSDVIGSSFIPVVYGKKCRRNSHGNLTVTQPLVGILPCKKKVEMKIHRLLASDCIAKVLVYYGEKNIEDILSVHDPESKIQVIVVQQDTKETANFE